MSLKTLESLFFSQLKLVCHSNYKWNQSNDVENAGYQNLLHVHVFYLVKKVKTSCNFFFLIWLQSAAKFLAVNPQRIALSRCFSSPMLRSVQENPCMEAGI